LTVPSSGNDRDRWRIKLIDATNTLTISGGASKTIDGATTAVISGLYDAVDIEYNGSEYFIF
jgi:hypothetical protein